MTPETDQNGPKRTYQYDPHLDPPLDWVGKAEHASFEVPTVSLHVHERIEPLAIFVASNARGYKASLLAVMAIRPAGQESELSEPIRFELKPWNDDDSVEPLG